MRSFLIIILFLTSLQAVNSQVIINEIHHDPFSGPEGDANQDGTTSVTQDEFVELVNVSDSTVDISGWSISDQTGIRHIFQDQTLLISGEVIVVFSGGEPNENIITVKVVTASTGLLGLNNGGDSITVADEEMNSIDSFTYETNDDYSWVRVVDADSTAEFISHENAENSVGYNSPGTRSNGTLFSGPVTSLEQNLSSNHHRKKVKIYSIKGILLYEGYYPETMTGFPKNTPLIIQYSNKIRKIIVN